MVRHLRILHFMMIIFLFSSCESLFRGSNISSKVFSSNTSDPIIPAAPTGLSYASSTFTLYKGESLTAQTPTVTGPVDSYSASAPLPAGLDLNTTTGIISGTMSTIIAPTIYTITATNAGGSTTKTITISVGPKFTLNNTADTADANVNDGICDVGNGTCSLRAAIQQTNYIAIPAKIELATATYTLGGAEIPVTTSVAIIGAGIGNSILSANNLARVFNISGGTTELSYMTIQNGASPGSDGGGAIKCAGGSSKLHLETVELKNNNTSTTSLGGGAIYASCPELLVSNSMLTSNTNTSPGGANLGAGAIYIDNACTNSTIYRSTFTGNTSTFRGGAVYIASASGPNIIESTFKNNSTGSSTHGGAIYVQWDAYIYRSTFESNSTGMNGDGGAIYFNNTFDTKIENSTFYGNSAARNGGAIYMDTIFATGSTQIIQNTTLVANTAGTTGGGLYCFNCNTGFRLQNSILTGNTPQNCALLSGTLTDSLGYNIESGASCALGATSDLSNTDPLVTAGAPAANGGPTNTISLQIGSPAINTADPISCLATDQRGTARPTNGTCDIGAFEN